MATYTENLNLKKPAILDPASIGDINHNMDIIDGTLTDAMLFETHSFDGGNFTAEQYRSDINYTIPSKDGYTPILLGVDVTTHTRILIVNSGLAGLDLNVRARNLYTSAQNGVNFRARVLWIKSELA